MAALLHLPFAFTWKSSAPGGRDVMDATMLTGNSANAELAAGQRSLTVSGMPIPHFNY